MKSAMTVLKKERDQGSVSIRICRMDVWGLEENCRGDSGECFLKNAAAGSYSEELDSETFCE